MSDANGMDIPASRHSHQHYVVDIPRLPSAGALSVQSFELTEALGSPYRITITLAHPDTLSRSDVLGLDATFRMTPAEGEPRHFAGCVTAFSRLHQSKDETIYRLVIEPHLARLQNITASRIFQQQTAPQIIEAILRRHAFQGHQFDFRLRRAYVKHDFRMQYRCSDWRYIRVLMEQEGIYCFIEQGKHGDIYVFADDVDHYVYQPALPLPYRESSGLNAASEAILSLETHAKTVAASYRVADYNPDAAWERIQAEDNRAFKDTTTYGQPYIYGTGHRDEKQAKWEAQLRHEAALAGQLLHAGNSTSMALRPARVVHTDTDVPESPNGIVITEVVHTGARDQSYQNTFKAIPVERRFRLPLDEASWPTIHGTLSARVTSPSHYDYAFLTKVGYYVVRFDFDFDAWNPGTESVPLRLAKPFAGKLQTGMHFPAQDGDEAVIAFTNGNPNAPFIAAFHHNSDATDLITNQNRWMSRNVIRTQADNKLQMEDWEGQEHIKLSTQHSGKSQLTLGHIVNGSREKRGEGFELRTDAHGAIRAGGGLLLSTDKRTNAAGAHRDMQEPSQLLDAAYARMDALATMAQQAQADAADVKAMNDVLQRQLKNLEQQVIVLSGKASVGIVTPETIVQSAGRDLTFSAGQSADIGVLRRFTVAAGEKISLFAQKLGMKLIAKQGKMDIQAQGGELQASALKDVTIRSIDGRLILTASKEVWIGADGSYIKINGNRIENGTPGDIVEKCAWWGKQGAQFLSLAANQTEPTAVNERFRAELPNGDIARQRAYVITRADGGEIRGITDADGMISLQQGLHVEGMDIRFSESDKERSA